MREDRTDGTEAVVKHKQGKHDTTRTSKTHQRVVGQGVKCDLKCWNVVQVGMQLAKVGLDLK